MPKPKTSKKATTTEEASPQTEAQESTAPVPTSRNKQAGSGSAFNIFSARKKSKEAEQELMAKAGLADGLKSAADIARSYLPLPHMALEWLTGRKGIPIKTINEFIGQENTGKSSLLFSMMGTFISHNIPCYYINTEPKMLETEWIARLVSPDPETAKSIADAITVSESTYTLDMMDLKMRNWAHIMRYGLGDECVPFDIPLVVVVDSLSKLLNPEEAIILDSGLSRKKDSTARAEAMKGVADISNKPAVTAKWHHEWVRLIAPFCEQYNVTLFLTSGQNTKMNANTPAYAVEASNAVNKTKVGGEAVNQSAGLQVVLTKRGMAKNSKQETIGRLVRMKVEKSSYGPIYRDIIYTIQSDKFTDDSPNYISQAIDMDSCLADALVENGVFGFKVDRKMYSSDELGIYQLKAHDLCDKIHSDPALRYKIGSALKISGYEALNPVFT